jgi:biopolymer transport protein ExbD
MVRVFQQFTGAANEETRADILAGVGESLYATAFGIAIAVFSFAIYNYFSARQRSLSIEADRAANQLIGYVSSQRPDTAKDNAPRRRQPHSLTNVGRTLKKTKIEIIPMIDTMFFLLVFFILSSVGIIKLQGLPVNLPEANSADRQQPAKITISVTPESRVKINNRDVKAGDDIGAILQNEIRIQAGSSDTARAEAQVVINADRDTPSRAVVDILSKAANVGIGRVSVATRKGAVAPGTP